MSHELGWVCLLWGFSIAAAAHAVACHWRGYTTGEPFEGFAATEHWRHESPRLFWLTLAWEALIAMVLACTATAFTWVYATSDDVFAGISLAVLSWFLPIACATYIAFCYARGYTTWRPRLGGGTHWRRENPELFWADIGLFGIVLGFGLWTAIDATLAYIAGEL